MPRSGLQGSAARIGIRAKDTDGPGHAGGGRCIRREPPPPVPRPAYSLRTRSSQVRNVNRGFTSVGRLPIRNWSLGSPIKGVRFLAGTGSPYRIARGLLVALTVLLAIGLLG